MDAARRIDAGEGYQGEGRSFETLPLLLSVFSEKRWKLIIELQKLGPSTLRGLARALGRDVKRVHEDANVLLEEGIIERDADKRLLVPFKQIRLEANLFNDDDTKAA
ncbi:MAG: transcriptional regulator [Hyphomicrobiales bacterium]|nr:MAG: transcriptional regulator [Hyphomicrobiales bacterium]